MTYDLSQLGWDEYFASAYRPLDRSDSAPGRVLRADRGVCTVLGADGVLRATPGRRRAARRRPRPGPAALRRRLGGAAALAGPAYHDRVCAAPAHRADPPDRGQGLQRPGAGRQHGHRRRGRADAPGAGRRAGSNGCSRWPGSPARGRCWCCRRATPRPTRRRSPGRSAELAPGVPVLPVSVTARRRASTPLRELVAPGRTLALLGPSGAGKSTLVNALAGADVMPVQAIRRADGKGRHTTAYREPGAGARRRRGAGHARASAASACWTPRRAWTRRSRTSPSWPRTAGSATAGTTAEPGCAVQAALARRSLAPRRLESWRKLHREVAVESGPAGGAAGLAAGRAPTGRAPGDRRRSGRIQPVRAVDEVEQPAEPVAPPPRARRAPAAWRAVRRAGRVPQLSDPGRRWS